MNDCACNDELIMARAITLAEQGRGHTAPNPSVGAVLVKDGEMVAEGFHRKVGGPHAEIEALEDARKKGIDPAECDLYVTLEPCNHHGKTPPCTQAILDAGIKRVVVGCRDVNPSASGGIEVLREREVSVTVGVLEAECQDLIADFRVWQSTTRPYVILKLAQTLDGKITARPGRPEIVTGPESRQRVHVLRARADAVLVGGLTYRVDNPRLDCRIMDEAPPDRQPLAVVVTTRLPNADEHSCLLRERADHTVFLTTPGGAASVQAKGLKELGCRIVAAPVIGRGTELATGLSTLREEMGVHTVLCEGGGKMAANLLTQGLVDELRIFLAPKVLGDDGAVAGFRGLNAPTMAAARNFRFARIRPSGDDLELILRPAPPVKDEGNG
jgi:diaminohydroxyphosphoribosylaminopyrimidine deaminase/5-amino-6-(5-phosphoribosylamino)uracil reductase